MDPQYLNSFESILYGLVISHILLHVGKMISNKENIEFSRIHLLMIVVALLTVIEGYYGMYIIYKNLETDLGPIQNKWMFFLTRVTPISALFITIIQLFPSTYEKPIDFNKFIIKRESKILVLLQIVLLSIVVRNWIIMFSGCSLEELKYNGDFGELVIALIGFMVIVSPAFLIKPIRTRHRIHYVIYGIIIGYLIYLMSSSNPYVKPECLDYGFWTGD